MVISNINIKNVYMNRYYIWIVIRLDLGQKHLDPKSFYGIWETQGVNVVSKCYYVGIWPVLAQKGVYLTLNSSSQCLND